MCFVRVLCCVGQWMLFVRVLCCVGIFHYVICCFGHAWFGKLSSIKQLMQLLSSAIVVLCYTVACLQVAIEAVS